MSFVSPGVYFRELDFSLYVPRLSTTVVGMVGTSTKGPTNLPKFITNVNQFVSMFGDPNPNHLSTYSALQYLREGNQLWFVRVNGADSSSAIASTILGQTVAARLDGAISGPFTFTDAWEAGPLGTNVAATLDIDSDNKYLRFSVNGGALVTVALTEGAGITKADIRTNLNTLLNPHGAKALAGTAYRTGTGNANAVAIVTTDVGSGQRIKFFAVDDSIYTDLGITVGSYSGTDSNLEFEFVSINNTSLVETASDGVFDAGSLTTDDVVTAINDQFTTDSFPATAYNVSNRVVVIHDSISQGFSLRVDRVDSAATQIGFASTVGFTYGTAVVGLGLSPSAETMIVEAISEGAWGNNVQVRFAAGSSSGSFRIDVIYRGLVVETFDSLVPNSSLVDPATGKRWYVEVVTDRSNYIKVTDVPTNTGFPVYATYSLSGGDDGLESIGDDEFVGSLVGDTATGLQIFSNAELIDVNAICAPGVHSAAVINEMLQIASSRGDCIAVIDPPLAVGAQQVVDWHNGASTYNDHQSFNSSYGALYWPWVKIYDAVNSLFVWVPPSGLVVGAYAYNDRVAEPWFAAAGFNRGRLLQPVEVEYNATHGEREYMYGNQNSVNPIVNFIKDGISIYGQRTLQRKPSALDRVNVRRLLNYIKKVSATAIKYLLFEPNDAFTWREFTSLVSPFLDSIQARRGLYEHRVVCDETTNTPDLIDNNIMRAVIYLKPVKAAEQIMVDLVITNTGANFDEIQL